MPNRSTTPASKRRAVIKSRAVPPAPKKAAGKARPTFIATDAAVTESVVGFLGPLIIYVPGRGWYRYDGVRYVPVASVDWEIVEAVRQLSKLGFSRKRYENGFVVRSLVRLAEAHPKTCVEVSGLDADPMILNLKNGELNLVTGAISAHTPTRRLTKLAGCALDKRAQAPRWLQFIDEVTCGRPALASYIQVLAGYCLTGLTSVHHLWVLLGGGANGKSVFLSVLRELLGDYARAVDPALLVVSKSGRHPTGLADLQGLRLAVAAELNAGEQFDEALVKRITGGDELAARRMHRDFFAFKSMAKLLLAVNSMPSVDGADDGIWRRMRVVPFDFKPKKQDPQLVETLKGELPGILNWALAGLQQFLRSGFPVCPEVDAATAAYRASSDIVGDFLQAMATPSAIAIVTAKDAYEKFFAYCLANDLKSPGTRAFHRAMGAHGHVTGKVAHGGVRGYRGLTIK